MMMMMMMVVVVVAGNILPYEFPLRGRGEKDALAPLSFCSEVVTVMRVSSLTSQG